MKVDNVGGYCGLGNRGGTGSKIVKFSTAQLELCVSIDIH